MKKFLYSLLLVILTSPSFAADKTAAPEVVHIPAGNFTYGSSREERELAYQLDETAYKHSVTRINRWYENEAEPTIGNLPAFSISKFMITNKQYKIFVNATGYDAPFVDEDTWKSFRLVHPYKRTHKYQWNNGEIPEGLDNHPVVLVDYGDATVYVNWLSCETGQKWRLPTELEWEKAARGPDGRIFPWGNEFIPENLNSHDQGPFSTMPVGSFPQGASTYGVQDMAGQVFEWTKTLDSKKRQIVKGGSWDDKGCGICRSSARHNRPQSLRHILLGFRLVLEPS